MPEPTNRSPRDLRHAVGSLLTASVVFAVVGLLMLAALFGVGAWLVSAVATGVFGTRDGDAAARSLITDRADRLVEKMGYWHEPTDAETLAADWFSDDSPGLSLRPLAWHGTVAAGETATVDVLLRAEVTALSPTTIGTRGRTAGSAHACYRFVVPLTDFVRSETIDCPQDLRAPTPTATQRPRLPDDAAERASEVLTDSRPGELAAALRAAFPTFTTEIEHTAAGEAVVAVGAPGARDCIVLVARAGGAVEQVFYDPVWLEPGELGCSTRLYTAPPQ